MRIKKPLLSSLLFLVLLGSLPWNNGRAEGIHNPELTGEPKEKAEAPSVKVAPVVVPSISTNTAPSVPATPEVVSRVATLGVGELREYETQPPEVQRLLASALKLTTLNLAYKYGSSDPKDGGMDCSGTIYYLLNEAGVKDVPRDSSEMYKWVWTQSRFQAVNSSSPDSFEFAALKPGDLLFWTGTYAVERDPPITHVMIYLGVNRLTDRRVMMGSSEGRTFNGISRYGVSVFDFVMPGKKRQSEAGANELQACFIGYGAIPGLDAPPSVK